MEDKIIVYVLQLVCYPYGAKEYLCCVKNHKEAEELTHSLTDCSIEHYCHILNTKKIDYPTAYRYCTETDLLRDKNFNEMSVKALKSLFRTGD